MIKKVILSSWVVLAVSCSKQLPETTTNKPEVSALVRSHATPRITYPFYFDAVGPFSIVPVSPTIVGIYQEMLITSTGPFSLSGGVVQGYDDLTIPTFPDRFFNGSFSFYGKGNDSLFAIVTVQTSAFTDPIDPPNGDLSGSEDFTGTFQIAGGTGHYLNARGSGTYTAHSEWRPPIQAGTLFSGITRVNATEL